MKKTRTMIAREAAREQKKRKWRTMPDFRVTRARVAAQQAKIIVGEDKENPELAKLIAEQQADHRATEKATIKRYHGKPKVRLQARARELEGIDVAPHETITFGSVGALQAYRRDLYALNGEKTAHFRTQRRGLTLVIWRDG